MHGVGGRHVPLPSPLPCISRDAINWAVCAFAVLRVSSTNGTRFNESPQKLVTGQELGNGTCKTLKNRAMLQAPALIFYIAVINYCLEVGNQQKD